MDCGLTCLSMISRYHGRNLNIEKIRQYTQLGKEGVNLYGISDAAEKMGFRTLSVKIPFDKITYR
jgi:ATP-binding cassette, subfamily B, bacterial